MKVVYGNELVTRLRKLCDDMTTRLLIAVPFIGNWKQVERIIGSKWITKPEIEVKLLTDIRNEYFIKLNTISEFQHRAEIRTLPGLHGKLYIIDDTALFTSANLTGTAFSKRYEIGIFQQINDSIIGLYNSWWKKARSVDTNWRPKIKRSSNNKNDEIGNGSLPTLWEMPPEPTKLSLFKKYRDSIKLYNHFRQVYENNVTRVWEQLPIYSEIDSFLNYLFHEHPKVPSRKYLKQKYRRIDDKTRINDLQKYHNDFKKWLLQNHGDSDKSRNTIMVFVQKKLAPNNIELITDADISQITRSINAMKSLPLNITRFLNKKNNTKTVIISAWKKLLHTNIKPIEERMEDCHSALRYFGKSAIQELIAFYSPDEYPPVNRNPNSGLKFFGYDIETY